MTALEPAYRLASTPLARVLAPALYAATLFASALLLFALQPMFAKMVLPRLGGAPSVWSVAMVFFQGALLAGYGYAHLLSRMLAPGPAALVHFILLAGAAVTLPIGIAAGFDAPPSTNVGFWLIGLFTVSIGLPFVALSASAPLLQNWFAASSHDRAGNPYTLYAASNLGSFAALIAYPFLVEPLLPLGVQAKAWSFGFAALAMLIAFAALIVARANLGSLETDTDRGAISNTDRFCWIALAAVPSGLVIAVTVFFTTDVAAAPFVWVVPLAIYLLTFVFVFRENPWVQTHTVARLAPIVVAPVAVATLGFVKMHWLLAAGLNLAVFVVFALLCHGELYRRRPAPRHLTEFYFCTSLGGVLGGAFAGLAAPHAFSNVYEYPILIAAALLALPGMFENGIRGIFRAAWPVFVLVAIVFAARLLFGSQLPSLSSVMYGIASVLLVALVLLFRNKPALVFALVILAFVFTGAWSPGLSRVETARSFFGVHQVIDTADGNHRLLFHGTTIHGAMALRDETGRPLEGRPEPLTYYYFGGPMSEAVAFARAKHGLSRVAVVGLGAGSLACHAQHNESWTFYEIDPEVVRIAQNPKLFNFLSACAPQARIVLGDARLTLSAAPHPYDLIVLDAFSSDAIPAHLLTREAFAGYLGRLSPHGMIVIHISNRHLDLEPVVAAEAAVDGAIAFIKSDGKSSEFESGFKSSSIVMALARTQADMGDLVNQDGWRRARIDPSVSYWTDDYSNILGLIVKKYLAR